MFLVISCFRCNDISLQIVGRASQVRGYVKTISRPYFLSAYKIDSQGSKHDIRDSIEQLLEGARFIYKVNNAPFTIILMLMVYIFYYGQDPASKTGLFRAPLIQTIINKTWFKNKEDEGVIHSEFSENGALPIATIAFVLMVVSF